ncbi:MAG TPA: hypothetical protein VKK31_16360 [Thermoanaerobaculia bacterium]|nr:hypothetical protein [Thermoanaerobaculia bacterium]
MKADPSRSVFINCPFDNAYTPLFEGLVFTTVCCGFTPRSSLESGTMAEPRMERIIRAVFESRYSIHDLSRNRGEGAEGLARFNMPLELGIAMARWYMTRGSENQHDWLLMVSSGHEYHRFISDLSGFDPARHDGTVETLIPQVMLWLVDRPTTYSPPNSQKVLQALPRFQLRIRQLDEEWGGRVPWSRILEAAQECAPKL